jgi:hypothetical protein
MADFGLNPTTHPLPISAAPNSSDLGRRRSQPNSDGTFHQEVCLYVPSALQANLTIGQPYLLAHGSTAGQYFQAVVPAGSATSGVATQLVVLVGSVRDITTAPTTGTYAWFAYAGKVPVLVDGTTDVAAGDTLKSDTNLITGSLVRSGTTRTTQVVGKALAAQTANSAVLIDVLLYGDTALNG